MTAERIVAALLAVAVLLAWARLILWQRAAGDMGARPWRMGLLLLAQPVVAVLLFLCLFPPALPVAGGRLTVLTADAPSGAAREGTVVALPEAAAAADAEAVPDLATALRRHPDARRIRLLGRGLTARDRDAARGLDIRFDPPPLPAGIVAFAPPERVAPGAGFAVGGQAAGVPRGQVELVDPAGRVTDSAAIDGDGRFILSGTARAAGTAEFLLRLRSARGALVEQATVPVRVEAAAQPRLLILAGAPGPEVKYLRRWASDAGYAVSTSSSAGGGIDLGDAPVAIDAASLRRFDLVVADDRTLDGRRGAILSAVRDGLGLILRDGTAEQWRSLGFAASGGSGVAPVALPPARDAARARTREGIGSADVPAELNIGDDVLPEIGRMDMVPGGRDAVTLLRDAAGTPLAAWRPMGMGRVAVWSGIDSFGLVLSGRRDLYGDWWGGIMAAVARPLPAMRPGFAGVAWAGERVALCGLAADARVDMPGGGTAAVRLDPAAGGCGAFWPDRAGWHVLQAGNGRSWPFFVQPADALPALRAERMRQATLSLGGAERTGGAGADAERPGSPWPWFAGWLALSALLWWFERSRLGRGVVQPSSVS